MPVVGTVIMSFAKQQSQNVLLEFVPGTLHNNPRAGAVQFLLHSVIFQTGYFGSVSYITFCVLLGKTNQIVESCYVFFLDFHSECLYLPLIAPLQINCLSGFEFPVGVVHSRPEQLILDVHFLPQFMLMLKL